MGEWAVGCEGRVGFWGMWGVQCMVHSAWSKIHGGRVGDWGMWGLQCMAHSPWSKIHGVIYMYLGVAFGHADLIYGDGPGYTVHGPQS